MIKFRLARPIRIRDVRKESIVLNPFAESILSQTDREIALSGGLVVVDCSWVNAANVFSGRLRGNQRKLPTLMAGNPTNYAKLNSLSSLEASAAAFLVMGFDEAADRLLSLYKWGPTFLSLNKDALAEYAHAMSQDEILGIERSYYHVR